MDALEEILKKAKVLRSDIAVLAGDLNWRLDTDHVWDGSVEHCIREGDWKSLREADELVRAHEKHGVLSDWTVPVCEFHLPSSSSREVSNMIRSACQPGATACCSERTLLSEP